MAILLRTMARKSVFDFGKFKDRTVQQCIDLKNHRMLRWYYYNCSMISFLPDILEEVGITDEWRIAKPGKDPDKGKELDAIKDRNSTAYRKAVFASGDTEGMGAVSHSNGIRRRRARAKYVSFSKEDRRRFSKANMQSANHGRGSL